MEDRKKQYFINHLRDKYRRSSKKQKGGILSELETCLKLSRKHCIRLMQPLEIGRPKNPAKRGRRSKYRNPDFILALRLVWKESGYLCSKKLKSVIPKWLSFIEAKRGAFESEIRIKLLSISAPTMDRVLKPYKVLKGKSLTRNGGFREEIPIQGNIWDEKVPGHIEVDTVAHCGGSMEGDFINSLTAVDITTLWTDVNGVYGRGSSGTFEALKQLESEFPFPILGYDSDNGGEVLNKQVISYFTTERIEQGREPINMTRARPYHKNDNAHVEQRNDAIARKYLKYDRLGFKQLEALISFYYRQIVCPLNNHFIPTFKLFKKIRIKSKTRRIYKNPKTAYDRLMESEYMSEEHKEKLEAWHKQLNPLDLMEQEKQMKKQIYKMLEKLKQNRPLTDKDLKLPEDVIIRPVFDQRPLMPKKLRQTLADYHRARA